MYKYQQDNWGLAEYRATLCTWALSRIRCWSNCTGPQLWPVVRALQCRPGILASRTRLRAAGRRSQEALGRLARKGQLTAVRKDLLVLPDVTGRVTAGLDQLIDAVAPEPYLITGGRALEHHRLTDQHYFSIPVSAPSRDHAHVPGERAVFLATSPEAHLGLGGRRASRYATPERVIVDVVDSPRYSVAFSQVVSALNLAVRRDPELLERLVEVLGRLRQLPPARRVGLLVDRLSAQMPPPRSAR